MIRTANPALKDSTFTGSFGMTQGDRMTLQGTINKSFILLLLLVLPAAYTWDLVVSGHTDFLPVIMIGGLAGGFILALVTVFKQTWSPVTSPLYALFEGAFLGALSGLMEMQFPGIVIQAVALTFGVFFSLLFVYKARLINVTENFRLGVAAATGGVALIYMASFILGFFNINIPYIHENGLIGIGFSLVVVVIAALNLVLDFDFIERGAERGAPAYMEWYAAFGLLVTLVWLYIEILRLLSKLRSR